MVKPQEWAFHETHFGAPRLQHYVKECGGDYLKAQELYEWNTQISSALWESIAYFEVALRNTIDAQLTARHTNLGRPGHWIFDDACELGRPRGSGGKPKQPYVDIETALGRVRKNRQPLIPGQIISEISFGFWHQLVSKKHTSLWPDIASGFPHAPSRNQIVVSEPVQRIRDIRNRIGHHHRIWNLDVAARQRDILDVAGYINPDLADWITKRSRVTSLLGQRP